MQKVTEQRSHRMRFRSDHSGRSGRSATARKELLFDLALLGYQMPSVTGSQLAQEIKFFAPHIPVVLISDHTVLPASELMFVDAHFGHGSSLDDLVETMRRRTSSKPSSRAHRRSVTAGRGST